MFAAMHAAEDSPSDGLMEVARDFSPRVEACGPREVTLDVTGLARLIGDGKTIASELRRTAAERGMRVHLAVAGTRTAARLLVHHAAAHAHATAIPTPGRIPDPGSRIPEDVIVIDPGAETASLAHLPIELLEIFKSSPESRIPNPRSPLPDPRSLIPHPFTVTLRRWGLRTLGDLVSLPPVDVAARLGQTGVEWQRLARGEDRHPLVPAAPEERFEQALDLEWPIEGLEPLSFVLGRLMEPLSAHLERRDRGGAVLHVRLHLVTREVHERVLQLPAPIRDARTLRTLALLDLEAHPPPAAIDRVVVAIDPTPGRVVQLSLLTRPLPSPEQLSTLMARLHALMGEGRCGAAVAVDSWEPGAFAMRRFAPDTGIGDQGSGIKNTEFPGSPIPDPGSQIPAVALRRFRVPVPVRVRVDRGVPVRVISDRRGWSGGSVETYAGPWRTSGGWWIETGAAGATVRRCDGAAVRPKCEGAMVRRAEAPWSGSAHAWSRDEWDVTLSDGATYRLFRARDTEAWFIEGVVD